MKNYILNFLEFKEQYIQVIHTSNMPLFLGLYKY